MTGKEQQTPNQSASSASATGAVVNLQAFEETSEIGARLDSLCQLLDGSIRQLTVAAVTKVIIPERALASKSFKSAQKMILLDRLNREVSDS